MSCFDTEAEFITMLRRKFLDAEVPYIHADEVYIDAICRAVGRVNVDLNTSYADPYVMPANVQPFVVVRACIEMCFVRGAEGASGDASTSPTGAFQQLRVPNLDVMKIPPRLDGPSYWRKLCDALRQEYKDMLDSAEDTIGTADSTIQQSFMVRKSARTGRFIARTYDDPGPAVMLALSLNGSQVTAIWTQRVSEYFQYYELVRDSVNTFDASPKTVFLTSDSHEVEYEDTPGTGTWYYRIRTYNSNDLYVENVQNVTVL